MLLVTIYLWKIRSEWVGGGRGGLRETGRGHWLEMLPICHRLTAFASGINSNKVELAAAAASLPSHTHIHTHSRLATGGAGKFTQLLAEPRSPIIASVSLPACQSTPSSRPSSVKLFSSSLLTQVANTMRTLATRKKAIQPDGKIVDGRERARGREKERAPRDRERALHLNGW